MNNLYRIDSTHFAPKDNHTAIETYLIAENNDEVYDYISKFYGWIGDRYEDYYLGENEVDHKSWCIHYQGELEKCDQFLNDLHYGLTIYSWELISENIDVNNFLESLVLGIIEVYKFKE